MAPAAVQPPEVQFAQRLAANEKRIRDRALKKLRGYIGVRTQRPAGTARGWARGWAEGTGTGTGIGTRTGPGAVAGAAAAPAGGRRGEGRKHHVCALSPARLLRGSSRRALFFFYFIFFTFIRVYSRIAPVLPQTQPQQPGAEGLVDPPSGKGSGGLGKDQLGSRIQGGFYWQH